MISLVPKCEKLSAKYLYLWLSQLQIAGTGTTQQQLTVPAFKKTSVLIPTFQVMEDFTNKVTPFFEMLWTNQSEIAKLSSIRDTLLPKLMSGKIDLTNIDI